MPAGTSGEKRILPSSPEYSLYNDLWNKYAMVKNRHIWLNENDLDDAEIQEIEETLRNHMQDLLDGLPPVFLQKLLEIDMGLSLDNNDGL